MQLVVFRDPQNGEYIAETILTNGTIQPLAFPNVDVSIDLTFNR